MKNSRKRKHNPPPFSPYYRPIGEGISYKIFDKPAEPETTIKSEEHQEINETKKEPSEGSKSTSQNNVKYVYNKKGAFTIHPDHEKHMCLFETLAKQNNMSTRQYYQMMKKDLTSAELTEWKLVLMGTKTHPQAYNVTPPVNSDQPFTCSGITSNGVCIVAIFLGRLFAW
ncbi:hypothetical protein DPMN_111024 [Dreissena polymorpha]|uniref:Uncharacterized protein n=1 Tax=Dreissena polymorpha TaxID=45954 RepID=A0A9D4KE97_DREPO|nr:hypothetical protein DPMN_111024 [Dreissena polymorpha]